MRLDADDWLDVNAIEIMYSKLEKNKKIELLFADYYEVNQTEKFCILLGDMILKV